MRVRAHARVCFFPTLAPPLSDLAKSGKKTRNLRTHQKFFCEFFRLATSGFLACCVCRLARAVFRFVFLTRPPCKSQHQQIGMWLPCLGFRG